MHFEKNMIGEIVFANYDVSVLKRYFHLSKHRKPGPIVITSLGVILALELKVALAHA